MPRTVWRVVCGRSEVIATFVPDQGVGQRRLAGVGPADEAGEAGPVRSAGPASPPVRVDRSTSGGHRPRSLPTCADDGSVRGRPSRARRACTGATSARPRSRGPRTRSAPASATVRVGHRPRRPRARSAPLGHRRPRRRPAAPPARSDGSGHRASRRRCGRCSSRTAAPSAAPVRDAGRPSERERAWRPPARRQRSRCGWSGRHRPRGSRTVRGPRQRLGVDPLAALASVSAPGSRVGSTSDQHGADPVAPALGALRGERQPLDVTPARRGSAPGRGAWPAGRRRCRRPRRRARCRTARRARPRAAGRVTR